MEGPAWEKTMLIWNYDEGGGYYDHVPPPCGVRPDTTPPQITTPPDEPGAFDRLGFRVPAVIVSPRRGRNYVSHHVHDHTSVLKLLETKWNLPALTFRDANASNLLDSLDLRTPSAGVRSIRRRWPLRPADRSCVEGEPGTIPPHGARIGP